MHLDAQKNSGKKAIETKLIFNDIAKKKSGMK